MHNIGLGKDFSQKMSQLQNALQVTGIVPIKKHIATQFYMLFDRVPNFSSVSLLLLNLQDFIKRPMLHT